MILILDMVKVFPLDDLEPIAQLYTILNVSGPCMGSIKVLSRKQFHHIPNDHAIYNYNYVCNKVAFSSLAPQAEELIICFMLNAYLTLFLSFSGGVVIFNLLYNNTYWPDDHSFSKDTVDKKMQSFVDNGTCSKWSEEEIVYFQKENQKARVIILNKLQ